MLGQLNEFSSFFDLLVWSLWKKSFLKTTILDYYIQTIAMLCIPASYVEKSLKIFSHYFKQQVRVCYTKASQFQVLMMEH